MWISNDRLHLLSDTIFLNVVKSIRCHPWQLSNQIGRKVLNPKILTLYLHHMIHQQPVFSSFLSESIPQWNLQLKKIENVLSEIKLLTCNRIFLRAPSVLIPICFKSSSVSVGKIVSSIFSCMKLSANVRALPSSIPAARKKSMYFSKIINSRNV